ncbi:MAG: hypothetical protein LBL65_05535 [Campylobacteraceae bacterium]|jgi:hypothetical protein|nr:hypothetical protein [Campylobacteraceae bacterium]
MKYLEKEIFDKTPLSENEQAINNNYVLVGKDYKKQEKFIFEPAARKFRWTYALKTRDEARELRAFFRANFGRFGTFWLPSHKRDVEFISYHQNNINAFVAKYAQRGEGTYNQIRHIYIPALNFAAKVTFTQLQNGREIITLNKPLPDGLEPDNTEWNKIFEVDFYDLFYPFLDAILIKQKTNLIMNLFLVRFASDEFNLSKRDSVWMESSLEFVELQKEST